MSSATIESMREKGALSAEQTTLDQYGTEVWEEDREFEGTLPQPQQGCKWTGELRNVEEHLKKDPTTSREDRVRGCGYQLSLCDKCEGTVIYVRMKAHLEEDCNHRIIACEFESVRMRFQWPKYQMPNHIQDDMLQHLSLVTRFVKRNNSSPRHSPEVKSNVYLAISVGIVLVGILAAILIHQQQKQNQIK